MARTLTTDRAESLLEVEGELRRAAIQYGAQQSPDNRKALRDAALAYADFASFLDDLINPDEMPEELAKSVQP